MNMKKLSFATIVMLGLGMSAAQATDGTLNFSGAVSATPCSIDASSLALTLNFDGIPVRKFETLAPGTTSSDLQKPLSIKLTGCPAGISSVKMMLDGIVGSHFPNVFVQNPLHAFNSIGAIVQDADTGATLVPKTFSGAANTKPLVAGSNTLNYLVGLVSTDGDIPVGRTVNIPISYTLSYQ